MNTLKYMFIGMFCFIGLAGYSEVNTDTLTVKGSCEKCEMQIEEAAMRVKGVKAADWEKGSNLLIVKYNPSKVGLAEIDKAVQGSQHCAPMKSCGAATKGCCKSKASPKKE
ncbi:MAG: cation transporter [Flavobacteriales bacterium]|nr:cation transporter [Flavobacteriales bacterium]